jgi:glycosyltransferase involved in cell wall biosynthesis
MKLLSVIIPMYNVEPYIKRCLHSLVNQNVSLDEYEIICINDGSPDNSRDIVLHMQKEFKNIILIDQDNQGVSAARNNGIIKASGRYLLFIDPDDYVDANSLSRILNNAEKNEVQVSFLGFTILNEDFSVRRHIFNKKESSKIFSGIETYFLARGDGRFDPDRMWGVLFERDFMNKNDFRYLPNVPYLEDGEFIARILCLAERCIFDGRSFYQRTTRQGSATNSKLFRSEKAVNGFLKAVINLKRFQMKENLNEKQKEFLNQPIVKFVLLSVNSSFGWRSLEKYAAIVDELKTVGLRRIKPDGCVRYYFINGTAYNLSPFLAIVTLFLYPRIRKLFHLFSK